MHPAAQGVPTVLALPRRAVCAASLPWLTQLLTTAGCPDDSALTLTVVAGE
jgi:hypothetical protein